MFSNDPKNPLDRMRLRVGDTSEFNEYLDDRWYIHYLEQFNNNETLACIECAKVILARFTGNTREIVDQVEIYGNQQFSQYLKWLKGFIEDPAISGIRSPVPFAGGISKEDMRERACDEDNNMSKATGVIDDSHLYEQLNLWNAHEYKR